MTPPRKFGGEIVGYDEVALGTSDFTTMLQKVRAAKPDVFIAAQFAADSVALLKQVHQMGLNKEMTIFNAFITNVVAKGLPPEALQGVYAMHYFYYDLSGFADKAVAKSAAEFTELFTREIRHPAGRLRHHRLRRLYRRCSAASSRPSRSTRKAVSAALMANERQVRLGQGSGAMAAGSRGRLQVRRLPGEGQRPGRAERTRGICSR